MNKDILVNLAIGDKYDRARDYAISLAETLDAHLTAIAFAYEPVFPVMPGEAIPAQYIDAPSAEAAGAMEDAYRLAERITERGGR